MLHILEVTFFMLNVTAFEMYTLVYASVLCHQFGKCFCAKHSILMEKFSSFSSQRFTVLTFMCLKSYLHFSMNSPVNQVQDMRLPMPLLLLDHH